jgi:hypothetical protein
MGDNDNDNDGIVVDVFAIAFECVSALVFEVQVEVNASD